MLYFTSPWLFCNYQSVLLNIFTFFIQFPISPCLRQPLVCSLYLEACFFFACSFILFFRFHIYVKLFMVCFPLTCFTDQTCMLLFLIFDEYNIVHYHELGEFIVNTVLVLPYRTREFIYYIYFKNMGVIPWWFFKNIYLFLDRREGREKERKRNINLWLPLMSPLLGTWPATQACTLTGNWTEDPLVCKPVLNPLTYQPGHSLVSFKLILDTVLVFNPFGPAYLCI